MSPDPLPLLRTLGTRNATDENSLHHTAPVRSVVIFRDSKSILTGSGDCAAILWDAVTGQPLRRFQGHTNQVLAVAVSLDGRVVVTGSHDHTAIVWDSQTGVSLHILKGHADSIYGVAVSPDFTFLVTGSKDTTGASGTRLTAGSCVH